MRSSAPPIDPAEVKLPRGWKYKSLTLGPITIPWYASPETQVFLLSMWCLLTVGMVDVFASIGGTRSPPSVIFIKNITFSDSQARILSCARYAARAVVGFFAGAVINVVGIRMAFFFGGLGYAVHVSSFLCENHIGDSGYSVFADLVLECCSGVLWSAQLAFGAAYAPERLKGRYISSSWIICNLGAILGSVASFSIDFRLRNYSISPGDEYYPISPGDDKALIGCLVLTFLDACLFWTLVDSEDVVCRDGSRVMRNINHPTCKTEILGLWATVQNDSYIILLFPMFFASHWFYSYHFKDTFDPGVGGDPLPFERSRMIYQLAQALGALLSGFALDLPYIRRATRALTAWTILFFLTFAIWGGRCAFQSKYARENHPKFEEDTLLKEGSTESAFWYGLYGFYGGAWKICVYWFIGAISNNSRRLAYFAGFYVGIDTVGRAIGSRGSHPRSPPELWPPYVNILALFWALLAGSLVVALPVIVLKVRDVLPVEEDLRSTDGRIDEDIGPGHFRD